MAVVNPSHRRAVTRAVAVAMPPPRAAAESFTDAIKPMKQSAEAALELGSERGLFTIAGTGGAYS